MAIAIPLTATTTAYTDPLAAVFDFGGTPYTTGYLWVQNAGAFISLKRGSAQGSTDWTPDFPTGPSLVPLVGGAPSLQRPNGPDRIFGVRARSLAPGLPAVVYGGVFQDGETAVIPSTQASGTITPGGVVIPSPLISQAFAPSTGLLVLTGAFQVVPGCTINFSVSGAGSFIQAVSKCYVQASGSAPLSPDSSIFLDGVQETAGALINVNEVTAAASIVDVWNGPVVPGNHVLTLRALQTDPGSAGQAPAGFSSLSVLVFDQ